MAKRGRPKKIPQEIPEPPATTDEYTPPEKQPKYTPLHKIRELVTVRGLSYSQAAKILGLSRQTVHERCRKHGIISNTALKRFKQERADMLAAKQSEILNVLDRDKLKSASAYQLTGMFGILYDKERLERGQTTENIGYADYTAKIDEIDAELAQLESCAYKEPDQDE